MNPQEYETTDDVALLSLAAIASGVLVTALLIGTSIIANVVKPTTKQGEHVMKTEQPIEPMLDEIGTPIYSEDLIGKINEIIERVNKLDGHPTKAEIEAAWAELFTMLRDRRRKEKQGG